jgi:hypothetical protein
MHEDRDTAGVEFFESRDGEMIMANSEDQAINLRDQLKPLVESALSFQPTVLSSGVTSSFYFDGKLVTLRPDGASLIARY